MGTIVQAVALAGFTFAILQLLVPMEYAQITFWFLYIAMIAHMTIWGRHVLQFHTESLVNWQTIVVCVFCPLFTYLFPTDALGTNQHLTKFTQVSYAVGFTILLLWVNHRFIHLILKYEPERRSVWDLSKRI